MKITMPANSVILFRNILGNAGWGKSIDDIYRGGKMLVSIVPEVPDGTDTKQPFDFELNSNEVGVAKKAIEFAIGAGVVPVSPWLVTMLDALELAPKP